MTEGMSRWPGQPDIVRHQMTTCPYCGYTVDSASQVRTSHVPDPQDGDFTICFSCLGIGIYVITAVAVTIREATAEEAAEAERDNAETIAQLRAFHARGGRR